MKKPSLSLICCMLSIATWAVENYPYKSDYLWVTVPNHADWIYKTGEQATVEVQFYKYGIPRNGIVEYGIGNDLMTDDTNGKAELKNGRCTIKIGTALKPCFRDLRLRLNLDGTTYQHHVKVGFSPEQIRPYTQQPKDFRQFWDEALKEAAKKEGKKEKPAKAPKPKKEKKPKEPDNSPKIPISIIATFLVLSISIIGVVLVGMTFTGLKRHMAQARELFDQGNYIAAYEKLNGYDFRSDEKVELLRNQSRTLADLQQCQDEYTTFMNYKMYNYALDSLIKGLGRYEKYKDDAVEYGIADEYDAFGNSIIIELEQDFGLTVDEAMAIYKQPNRHYYTIELRKVLRKLGLPDT